MGFTKMLTTRREFSARARSTRLMCPAWSAPIVGTSPITPPSRCQLWASARISDGDGTTTRSLPGPVLGLFVRGLGLRRRAVGRVGVFGRRKRPRAHVFRELVRRAGDVVGQVCVPLH